MLLAIGPLGPVKLLRSYCWRKIPLSATEQPKEVRDPDCTLTQPDATAVRELGGDFPGNLLLSGAAIERPLWGHAVRAARAEWPQSVLSGDLHGDGRE